MPSRRSRCSRVLDTGPITNHVNFAYNANGRFAYVTVGGLNEVKVFNTDDFAQVATIGVGKLPHGVWPSGDGTRVYVGLENADALTAIDTLTNRVIATSPIGQAPQAIAYVSNAVPEGDGLQNLQPIGLAGMVTHFELAALGKPDGSAQAPTSVSLFDQGLTQVLEASVTGLQPKQPYVLALSSEPSGGGALEATGRIHDQPCWIGDRQCGRADTAGGARGTRTKDPLSGHLVGDNDEARHGAAGSAALNRLRGRNLAHPTRFERVPSEQDNVPRPKNAIGYAINLKRLGIYKNRSDASIRKHAPIFSRLLTSCLRERTEPGTEERHG